MNRVESKIIIFPSFNNIFPSIAAFMGVNGQWYVPITWTFQLFTDKVQSSKSMTIIGKYIRNTTYNEAIVEIMRSDESMLKKIYNKKREFCKKTMKFCTIHQFLSFLRNACEESYWHHMDFDMIRQYTFSIFSLLRSKGDKGKEEEEEEEEKEEIIMGEPPKKKRVVVVTKNRLDEGDIRKIFREELAKSEAQIQKSINDAITTHLNHAAFTKVMQDLQNKLRAQLENGN